MGKILDNIIWWMNAFQPDHRAEDAVFDLMVEDIQQKYRRKRH